LQGTTLLTILPPRKVPAFYWARLQCKKRKSSEFQPYFICAYEECPNACELFLIKRDVLHHFLLDHQALDPNQMTFLVTDGHLNNEEDDEMEEASTTTQTYNPQAG